MAKFLNFLFVCFLWVWTNPTVRALMAFTALCGIAHAFVHHSWWLGVLSLVFPPLGIYLCIESAGCELWRHPDPS